MKTPKWLLVVLLALCPAAGLLLAQEASRTIDQTFQFDENGDAKIEISFQYGASQWADWKEEFGDHPDMMLRNLRYQFASAVIEDFALTRDDVRRQATGKMKALALARYRSGGQFSIAVPKNMKLVAGSGTEWVFTNSSLMNGELLNQTLRAKLPAKAKDAHFSTGGDFDQLTYSLEMDPPRSIAWIEAGVILLILGGAVGAISFRKKTGALPSSNLPPPQTPPALPLAS